MDAQLLWDTFDRLGVRFVNYFGIGQVLELDANCSYYLDCPGVGSAIPSIKNDFVNGLEKAAYDPDKIHITLSDDLHRSGACGARSGNDSPL